jgi:hypothetical protein
MTTEGNGPRAAWEAPLAIDAAVAAGAVALQVLSWSARAVRAVTGPFVRPVLAPLAWRGRPQREALEADLADALHIVVPRVLDAVLDQVDLTQLVLDRVDVDAVVARADVDVVVARADIDAVLARIDLIALAETIIDGVDLPGIIRESTGSIASEGIRGVRMQTIDADERVNRLVDRVLLRRQARLTDAPVPQQPGPLNGDTP